MSEPTNTPTDHESAQRAAEESVKYSHPGAPTPPGDETDDTAASDRAASAREASDEESVMGSHPGSPTPPGDAES